MKSYAVFQDIVTDIEASCQVSYFSRHCATIPSKGKQSLKITHFTTVMQVENVQKIRQILFFIKKKVHTCS